MKVLKLVRSCNECPHATYYSGGTYDCVAAGARLPQSARRDGVMPAWCPLTEYPAAAMNDLSREVERLHEALRASQGEVSDLKRAAARTAVSAEA